MEETSITAQCFAGVGKSVCSSPSTDPQIIFDSRHAFSRVKYGQFVRVDLYLPSIPFQFLEAF